MYRRAKLTCVDRVVHGVTQRIVVLNTCKGILQALKGMMSIAPPGQPDTQIAFHFDLFHSSQADVSIFTIPASLSSFAACFFALSDFLAFVEVGVPGMYS